MWLFISEKVVSNLRLAGGSLRALQLPPPPKTDIPYPPHLRLITFPSIQILGMHVKSPRRRSTTALEEGVQTAVHAKNPLPWGCLQE